MLDVCSTYWRIKTQNDWGISQKRSQIFRIMKEMRIVLRFACFLQSLLLFVHFFFLLGIYKVGAVCMCSLSQLVGYISFSITPGCWALVTLGMMVCSLKVFPDLVAHTGFSPLVFFSFSPYVTVSSSAQLFFFDTRLCFHDFNLRTVTVKTCCQRLSIIFFFFVKHRQSEILSPTKIWPNL